MRPLYIFDLDGTLALIEHRLPVLAEPGDPEEKWARFFSLCVYDDPNISVLHTLDRLLYAGVEVWVWTGRSEEVRQQTVDWLNMHLQHCHCFDFDNCLFMRPVGDHRPDAALKAQWLTEMSGENRARLVAAFEDRAAPVRMFRDNGVPCFQVAEPVEAPQ